MTFTQIRKLIADKQKWFEIRCSSDYHYPGRFSSPDQQRMGYCADIGLLPNYEPTNPHFLFSNIQLGKGTPRGVQETQFDVDGRQETVPKVDADIRRALIDNAHLKTTDIVVGK